jgi:hypothetical protein
MQRIASPKLDKSTSASSSGKPHEIAVEREGQDRIVSCRRLLVVAGLGVAMTGVADTASADTYRVDIYGTVLATDHDALSDDESCSEGFDAIVAVFDDQGDEFQENSRTIEFNQCGDGVRPIISIRSTLLDDGAVHVKGELRMWSEYCTFGFLAYNCASPESAETATFSSFDLVLYPDDRVDVSASGDVVNTVEFQDTKVSYLRQSF